MTGHGIADGGWGAVGEYPARVSDQTDSASGPVVLFTAFEPSGDALAAPVIERLLKTHPEWTVYAWGGERMEAAGARMAGRTAADGAMGLGAISHVRAVSRQIKAIRRWIKTCRLMVHVPVDSPAANFPICKASRKAGARVVHLAAPQMWAWGRWRVKKLKRLTDLVLCLLPFEPRWFGERGIKGTFVGHPAINRELSAEELRSKLHGLPAGAPRLALLPGSRTQEVRRNIKLLVRVFSELRNRQATMSGVIVASSPETAKVIHRALGEFPVGLSMVSGMRDEAIAWSDLALTVSGTVTLDIMRQCHPMIGVYKTGVLSWIGAKLLLRTKYKLLPNIIADDLIVPEYVPWCRGAGKIITKAQWLLDDSRRTAAHQHGLRRALGAYKGHDFAGECAKAIADTVKSRGVKGA
jgi:lipid-A-disaccharide synthase